MAALGAPRDDSKTLQELEELSLEICAFYDENMIVRGWTDYHTIGGGYDPRTERQSIPRKADNGVPGTVVTHREYVADARFGAVFAGPTELLHRCHAALVDPCWGLWLGRKGCIPAEPIAQGVHDSREAAVYHLEQLAGRPIARTLKEVATFDEGTDSLMDVPLDFRNRRFSIRRIEDVPPSTS